MKKTLPRELTSYDFLKALAVILMILDHVGYHFYPDEMWFRTLGRLCIPIWFFFIGYANGREITRPILIGGAVMTLSSLAAGQFLLPLDILITIAIARYYRDGMIMKALRSPETLRGMFLILFFATFPTQLVFEYGTMAMLFVLLGFITRHREKIQENIAGKYLKLYAFTSYAGFYIMEGVSMPSLSGPQALVMLAGFIAIGWILWNFTPKTYPTLTEKIPKIFVWPIQIMGRYTLEIYVLHLLLFRTLGVLLYPDRFPLFDWRLAPGNMMGILT